MMENNSSKIKRKKKKKWCVSVNTEDTGKAANTILVASEIELKRPNNSDYDDRNDFI